MSEVYYHHPDDKQFSLSFVNRDPRTTLSEIVGYEGEIDIKVMKYDYDQEFYAVYTKESGGEPLDNILVEKEFRDESDNIIIRRTLTISQRIINENVEREGSPVVKYKEEEVEKLPEALDRVDWNGTATEVAGQLISNIILVHALPNANHRTAISMAQVYLRKINPGFSMPDTTTDEYDWRQWVNEYIRKSKEIITVRRKNVLLKYLRDFGVEEVERRNEIRIRLDDFKLDMTPAEAQRYYAEKHEQLWNEFVEEAVDRANMSELKHRDGLSKIEFSEKIE